MLFKKTKAKIRTTIADLKAAFRLLVVTLDNLNATVAANNVKVEALAAEQRELRQTLAKIETNTGYLATAKKADLQRAGHRS